MFFGDKVLPRKLFYDFHWSIFVSKFHNIIKSWHDNLNFLSNETDDIKKFLTAKKFISQKGPKHVRKFIKFFRHENSTFIKLDIFLNFHPPKAF